jgi:hypothetical protein
MGTRYRQQIYHAGRYAVTQMQRLAGIVVTRAVRVTRTVRVRVRLTDCGDSDSGGDSDSEGESKADSDTVMGCESGAR